MTDSLNNADGPPSNEMESDAAVEAQIAAWVAQAKQGDEDAFGELVKHHHERLFGVLVRILRDAEDAREAAQVTWVKAWQRLDSFKGDSRFFTWLYRIAVNTGLDASRSRGRRREVPIEDGTGREVRPAPEWAPATPAPDAALRGEEIRSEFETALATLSPEHRATLVLREVEGLSYQEIAASMKCRVGTVMSRLFYARRALQDRLKGLR